jgi:pyruvyltransferase
MLQYINLIYHKDNSLNGNFGDELSKFITSKLINNKKYKLVYNQDNIKINLVCIGSYIHCAKNESFIYGSGIRSEDIHYCKSKKFNVCAVRGPLTKKILEENDIKVNNIFGDPALLLPKFYKPIINHSLKNKIGVIPHKSNYNKYININSSIFHLISPTNKWMNVINDICSCKAIISSSLHGLICSDAYNIPNLWIDQYKLKEGDFKFKDYFQSQNRDYIKISNLNQYNDNLLYKNGNKIDLDKLIDAFPFM